MIAKSGNTNLIGDKLVYPAIEEVLHAVIHKLRS